MPIDVQTALAWPGAERMLSWTERDVILYHLSLGAGRRGADPELGLTYERALQVLPTFALVAGQGISSGRRAAAGLQMPGIDVDLRRLLHVGQSLRLHRPIPPHGSARLRTRILGVWDKGSAAIIDLEHIATAPDDTPLWTSGMQILARGEGGFGGARGEPTAPPSPRGPADLVFDVPTTPDQALLYRLNGDLNPLHIDPDAARAAHMDRPILHGLASLGILTKALLDAVAGGDFGGTPTVAGRFAGVLHPGETLQVAVWQTESGVRFEASCPERGGAPVLSHGLLQPAGEHIALSAPTAAEDPDRHSTRN